jgi:hypothetical protein
MKGDPSVGRWLCDRDLGGESNLLRRADIRDDGEDRRCPDAVAAALVWLLLI